jgi:galactose mutarotase-like enzyme
VPITRIASDKLSAEIAARGAELVRLTGGGGRELLWDGDPQWWTGRSPLLFPIVGKVPGDLYLIDGQTYELPQHGFARVSDFALVDADRSSCTFELRPTPETLRCYPFAFVLRVRYRIDGGTLSVAATVVNEDARPMPFSFGFHPAFRWPLASHPARDGYAIGFERDESAPVRRGADGLLIEERFASPVQGRTLPLQDSLFERGAIIFDTLASRSVTYGPQGAPVLRIGFRDMPHLGIWTKPGAPYVCIEPWQGYAAPVGIAGELRDKPGIVSLPPGAAATYEMTIAVIAS